MQLSSILHPHAVFPRLAAGSKKQALKMLSALAADRVDLAEKEIFHTLLERELHGSTGMGGGIAIPHGRFEGLGQSQVFFASLEKPVEFGADDDRPVDLMFMLLTPAVASNEHIKALALVSKLLREKSLCEKLRATNDAQAIYALLMSYANDE